MVPQKNIEKIGREKKKVMMRLIRSKKKAAFELRDFMHCTETV
jgi:hypothetical protein